MGEDRRQMLCSKQCYLLMLCLGFSTSEDIYLYSTNHFPYMISSMSINCAWIVILAVLCSAQDVVWRDSFGNGTFFGDPHLYYDSAASSWNVALFATNASGSSVVSFAATSGKLKWSTPIPQTSPMEAYSGWCDDLNDRLFCGTDDGVVALSSSTGVIEWTYASGTPNPDTPSHPTAVAPGWVVFTFENGHNSSVMSILNASNGMRLGSTSDRVFTKIWPVASMFGAVTFCSINDTSGNIQVSVVLLNETTQDGDVKTLWRVDHLPYSPPGLWDNPNLDVDREGHTIFMYQKLQIGLRRVVQLDSTSGALLWNLTTVGHVIDYDTYAFRGMFFRLITNQTSVGGDVMVEAYQPSSNATSTTPVWSGRVPLSDPNAILLVGGRQQAAASQSQGHNQMQVFVVGLNTGTLWRVHEGSGEVTWGVTGYPLISTAVVGPFGDTVIFGVGSSGDVVSLSI